MGSMQVRSQTPRYVHSTLPSEYCVGTNCRGAQVSTCYALQVERVGVLACTPPLRARPPFLFGLFPR